MDNIEDANYHDNDYFYENPLSPNLSQLSEKSRLAKLEQIEELKGIQEFQDKCLSTSTQLPVALEPALEKALAARQEMALTEDKIETPKRQLTSPLTAERPVKAIRNGQLGSEDHIKQTNNEKHQTNETDESSDKETEAVQTKKSCNGLASAERLKLAMAERLALTKRLASALN